MTESTEKLLKESGWREYPNQFKKHSRCFYKIFETPTRCASNDHIDGMQVELAITEREGEADSFEIELTGGLDDETWMHIQNYSLPHDINKVLGLIPRLLATWEAANK